MEFETFKGNIRKYPRFKEQFLRHIKPQYTACKEGFVLRSFLDADIRDEVENVGVLSCFVLNSIKYRIYFSFVW